MYKIFKGKEHKANGGQFCRKKGGIVDFQILKILQNLAVQTTF